jgi:phosphoribosylaminoimidazole-succinocarboxamide synthase
LEKRGLIYEGKAKCLYATDREDYLVQEFKDELADGEGGRKNPVPGKGETNNGISCYLFQYLESYHVPTHFVERYGPMEMLVRKLAMIPIEVEMHNIVSIRLAKTFALVEGSQLNYPILEYYLKSDPLGDPMINEYHALALGYAQPEEMRTVGRLASKINAILKSFFERRGLLLASFKIEFGKQNDQIYVGDEISLDSCCFWDRKTTRRVDFERARHDPVVLEKMYREFYDRLTNSS